MAKVTGPLMSLEASGSVYGALTFAKWKGRPYVRSLVIPSNPQTTLQTDARNQMRVAAYAQRGMNLTALKYPGAPVTDKALWTSNAPSGQAWNGYMVKTMIGVSGANYAAAQAAYAALLAADKTAWQAEALVVIPGVPSIPQDAPGGVAGVALTAGEAFFIYCWGASLAFGRPAPGAVPPAYA